MSKVGFCQHDAGVLKDDKLSEGAKRKFIDDVKRWLINGSPDLPIPCGPKFPAVPHADRIRLEIEEEYPEWHSYALGTYEKIAKALDFKSQFTILPICDPIALAVALNIDPPSLSFPGEFLSLGLNLPLLAFKLGFTVPVDLALEFPNLLTIPPGINLNLPLPPDFDIEVFFDLFKFAVPFPKFPDLLLGLMLKMPQLFIKLLAFDFSVPCDVVLDAQLFGPFDPNKAIVWAVTQAVLASKTAECMVIAMTGATVGSASAGITGAEGEFFGYTPPPMGTVPDDDVRDRIVKIANDMDESSWGKDNESLQEEKDIEKAKLQYTEFMYPNLINFSGEVWPRGGQPPARKHRLRIAFDQAKGQSSCGVFLRGVYYAAGASDAHFTRPYIDRNNAILGTVQVAKKNGGILWEGGNAKGPPIPPIQRGDAILVYNSNQPGREHVMLVVEDYPGGTDGHIQAIEGGRGDPLGDTNAKPSGGSTRVARGTYEFVIQDYRVKMKRVSPNTGVDGGGLAQEPREVSTIMDGERIVMGPV